MRAIMLSYACRQPYHTLRAAAAAGYEVHVLGGDCAPGLQYSRYCASYHNFDFDPLTQPLDVALAEINRWAQQLSADIILPADIISTRILVALEGRLPVPSCALPSAAAFDMLNDKWQFYQMCREHDVNVPPTWLFDSAAALKAAVSAGKIPFPLIIKPLDSSGGSGIQRIMQESDLKLIDQVQYAPLLAQKIIEGNEIDISILANRGQVGAYAIQRNLPDKYVFIHHEQLLGQAAQVARACGLHGLAHFDAIIEKSTGKTYLIECNPRVWFSLFAATVAGLNFVKLSLKPEALDLQHPLSISGVEVDEGGSTVKLIKKLIRTRSTNKADYRLLYYNLADPVGKKVSRQPQFDVITRVTTDQGTVDYQVAALAALRLKSPA